MASGDGNGWVACPYGHRHWGRFGAAGLVLVRRAPSGAGAGNGAGAGAGAGSDPGAGTQILMQLRAAWTHEGGRWSVPGGARDSHESIPDAAVREAHEEAGIDPRDVQVVRTADGADHGTWSYTYVIALAEPGTVIGPPNDESDELAWVGLDDIQRLPLHSGLASAWTPLRQAIISALAAAATDQE